MHETVLGKENYSEQITQLNSLWWKDIFPGLPEFIALDAEEIVREILIRNIKKNTPLSTYIADLRSHHLVEEYFDGISCCFEKKKKK